MTDLATDFGVVSLTTAGDDSITPKPMLDVELGVPMSMPFSVPSVLAGIEGMSREGVDAAHVLLRLSDISVRQLMDMRRKDGQARALYRLMTLPIRAALNHATWLPAEGDTGEAQFLEDMVKLPMSSGGMEVSWSKVTAQTLMALFDGFAFFEEVKHVPTRGPMAGKITIKSLAYRPSDTVFFIVDDHGHFDGGWQRCLTGDTEVLLLDGTQERIDKLADRTEPFWVYSTNETGSVVPGKAVARKTSDSEPLVEVELDNGERVRCTLTHPWRLRDGTYKRAACLQPGDSLMPLYRKSAKLSGNGLDYEQVYHPEGWSDSKTGQWQWTHSMVAQDTVGSARGGEVIHHGDFNRFNNDPSNLQRITKKRHSELHTQAGQLGIKYAHAWWATEAGKKRRAELSAGGWGAAVDPKRCSATRRRQWAEGVYDHLKPDMSKVRAGIQPKRPDITLDLIQQAVIDCTFDGSSVDMRSVARSLKCSPDILLVRVREAGFSGWLDFKRRQLLRMNHKVRAVRAVPAAAVYDIEVEDYHNFALAAGVFVHNTVFQGRPISVRFERENSFYYAANEEENPYYGVSYFESAFYHYDKKVKLYYLAHLAAQHRAVGTRIGKIPANANVAEKAAFRKALSDFGLAQAMLVPEGYAVESLAQSLQSFDFLALINHHNNQMSKSVLVFFIDDDKATRLVDFSSEKDDMFLLMEHAIMDEVADRWNNELFPKYIDWNFGTGCYPTFQWGPFTDEQKAAVRTLFSALAIAAQTNVTPEFLFELEKLMADELGLEIDYEDIENRVNTMNALKEQAQQAALLTPPPVPGAPPASGTGGGPPAPAASKPVAPKPAAKPSTAGSPKPAKPAGTSDSGSGGKFTHTEQIINLTDLAREVLADMAAEEDA